MPRKRELTWQPGKNGKKGRWRKKYKGRTLYLGFASSKSDLEAYQQAVKLWQQKKAEIDAEEAGKPKPHQADYEKVIAEWELVLRWSIDHDDSRTAALAREQLAKLRDRLSQKHPIPVTLEDRFESFLGFPPPYWTRLERSLPKRCSRHPANGSTKSDPSSFPAKKPS